MKELINMDLVKDYQVEPGRKVFSATHEEILAGYTSDVYFVKTRQLLQEKGLDDKVVTAEIFTSKAGIFAGREEAVNLLRDKNLEIEALPEGKKMEDKEVVMSITGRYCDFGIFETAILGIFSSSSGWATRAAECKEAAQDKMLLCFGSRHIHPSVAPVMERAAMIGGCDGASCILGAKLMDKQPSGTIPHAAVLLFGDTVEAAVAYHEVMPPYAPRIILVDTFKDEAEESLRVAGALKKELEGVRLDTPSERGGVTPELVREVRARLDQAGYINCNIIVSGGLNPERITILQEAGAGAFGVGSYIANATPINMTMDIKAIEGRPIAKRGRIPGPTKNPRLERI
ncbi:MAG: nicotinate phosphoribosyltransferase [Halanaerobium sp.]|nr:nicotinate phosphoribosyltransferase [Halanaerobium sp.]